MAKSYSIIGLMSGTSVDGLDVAYCRFGEKNSYTIVASKTYKYPDSLKNRLKNNMTLSTPDLLELDAELGYYFGYTVNKFLKEYRLPKPQAIASHGHTVYHNPGKSYTLQIGKGSHIAAVTGLTVVCDFRSTDVALGGQGAPLVPVGDQFLFAQYDYCLNLGGIANISVKQNNKRIAWDIGPCNLPVNVLMYTAGKEFDRNGETGKKGRLIPALLHALNRLPYYKKRAPKSLGREWIEKEIMPHLRAHKNVSNVLRTYYEHIAIQISAAIKTKGATVLVTGGGAHNKFLMQLIHQKTNAAIIAPQPEIIDFKEALIFAYLGYLRLHNKVNSLSSVTGAKKDSVGGAIYS
ncbi:MAG TPA: anhydro-N-acetylmuramic acid kinase [Flavobacteriales bacterium]|nr:anhydro-N-acetylmuramic acid kinase [Flavobacteriales bacterium]